MVSKCRTSQARTTSLMGGNVAVCIQDHKTTFVCVVGRLLATKQKAIWWQKLSILFKIWLDNFKKRQPRSKRYSQSTCLPLDLVPSLPFLSRLPRRIWSEVDDRESLFFEGQSPSLGKVRKNPQHLVQKMYQRFRLSENLTTKQSNLFSSELFNLV